MPLRGWTARTFKKRRSFSASVRGEAVCGLKRVPPPAGPTRNDQTVATAARAPGDAPEALRWVLTEAETRFRPVPSRPCRAWAAETVGM